MAFETLDEANSAFKSLEERLNALETENTKLKATKEGLQGDLKKRKQIATFLKVAGIELTPDMSDEEIAEKVLALKAANASEEGEEGEGGGAGGSQSQNGQQQPQGGAAAAPRAAGLHQPL